MVEMISRRMEEGVGCAVADVPEARYVYATATGSKGDVQKQTRDALAALAAAMDEHGAAGSVVRQAVFVADPSDVPACRRLVEEFYGHALPATTYVTEPPCPGRLVAIEAHGLAPGERPFQIERISRHVVVTRYEETAWCHCGGVTTGGANGSLHAGAIRAFGQMATLLDSAGFQYSQVVRTWLYLGDIVGPEVAQPRYQELNRARAEFYSGVPFPEAGSNGAGPGKRFYPASTGIGAAGDGVTMSCIALVGRTDEVRVVALENPNQTPAFEYDGRYGLRSPTFSRAVAVATAGAVTLFVSGTASITGAESRHAGDVSRQTHQTLDNIAALVDGANLARHGLTPCGATLGDLAQLRVYLKRADDYDTVRAICREQVGELPVVYAVADICRPELLVEIEAVGFVARVTAKVAR